MDHKWIIYLYEKLIDEPKQKTKSDWIVPLVAKQIWFNVLTTPEDVILFDYGYNVWSIIRFKEIDFQNQMPNISLELIDL